MELLAGLILCAAAGCMAVEADRGNLSALFAVVVGQVGIALVILGAH